jgi:hypothetical protein
MGRAAKLKPAPVPAPAPVPVTLKLDLGCGPHPREGFTGVDRITFPGVSVVTDLRERWPWDDSSVAEAHMSHVLEHFTSLERCHVMNELYRVLVPGGTCQVIVPHWASCRAYGDPTHQWPPVSEFFWYYLKKDWRIANAPHTDAEHLPGGFQCDFEATWGYALRPDLTVRNQEYQQMAIQNYKEVITDMFTTLKALKTSGA